MRLALLLLSGCGASIYFEHEEKGSSVVQGCPNPLVCGVLSAFPQAASFTNMKVTESQTFQNQGVKKEDVKSVKLRRLGLRVASPNDVDFSWLQSIKFFAETGGQKELIAQKQGIDQLGLKSPNPAFDLELTNVEIKPYVVAPSFSITTEAVGRQPPKDTTIEATVRLGIDAVVVK